MGVQITELVEGRPVALAELAGRRIAIDAFNWLYQFLTTIRQKDGTPLQDSRGHVTSHLSGIFYRSARLLEAGVKPVYVFDGPFPEFKAATVEQRRDVRAEAMREWKAALARKDYDAARRHAQRSTTLTSDMISDSKTLLDAMGIPWVQAPSEGEALCSLMTRQKDAYATATQDYDSLLFGCPRLVRNLSAGKKQREIELILLQDVLARLGIGQDQLILLGILVGTDYNPGGISGYGPKRALELVREKNTLSKVLEHVVWEFDVPAEEIYEFFRHPPEGSYELEFAEPDAGQLQQLLCVEHDFSSERVDSALARLQQPEREQKSLGKWL